MRFLRVVLTLLTLCCLWPCGAYAQTDAPLATARYQPGLRFRTLTTGRVHIYFHQGEEALAQRLVRIVQEVAPEVDRRLGAPYGDVHVILVDQTDVSNGWATVIPYNLIEIAAVPPRASSMIGNTDDWLRLVFAHEYTHVVHLEKSGGWLGRLRHVFGRLPLAYPNLFLPGWQIEGLATFEESAITGSGRVRAGDFRMMLDDAARADRFAPLDRAGGGVIDWPGGAVPYLYGAYFHEYLAARFGDESLARLADATAARVPFLGSRAFKSVFGESLGTLWKQFEAETRRRANLENGRSGRTRLTTHGFSVEAPVFSRDGRLFYTLSTPHGFPSLMEWRAGEAPRHVTSRYGGNRTSAADATLVFDQLEVTGNIALRSDIYAADIETGEVRRLTREARAADPDVSPDGRTIVCTVQEAGRRILATFAAPATGDVAAPAALISEADTEYSAPRWSPDGRSLVAERRQLGGPSELVIIDVATRAVRPIVSSRSARHVSPVWVANGSAVLFASSTPDRGFTLHSVDVASGRVRERQDAGIGARSPTVSPDGTRLVFVGYSASGYDLYSLPFDSAQWSDARELRDTSAPSVPQAEAAPPGAAARPYAPLRTLAPRFWVPYFEADGDDTVVGAATGGFDVLGRHAYALTAGWAMPRNRANVQAEYSYTRWWPAFFVGVSDDTSPWRGGYLRSRDASAGVLLPFRRVRWSASALAAIGASRDDLEPLDPLDAETRRRTAGRLGLAVSNVKTFGYSISPEHGAAMSVRTEFAAGGAATAGANARSVIGEFRAYVPVRPRHSVLAMRVAAATSRGDDRARREFSAGGSGPQGSGFEVGVDAVGLLRGFASEDVFGRTAAVANIDYRIPLAWPQRGVGTMPLLLRSVHAALFADAGNAWDERFRSADLRTSVGAELSVDLVLGWTVPATVTTGLAWRDDPVSPRRAAAAFARIGRAF